MCLPHCSHITQTKQKHFSILSEYANCVIFVFVSHSEAHRPLMMLHSEQTRFSVHFVCMCVCVSIQMFLAMFRFWCVLCSSSKFNRVPNEQLHRQVEPKCITHTLVGAFSSSDFDGSAFFSLLPLCAGGRPTGIQRMRQFHAVPGHYARAI